MLKNRDSAEPGFCCAAPVCEDGVDAISGVILVPVTVSGIMLSLLRELWERSLGAQPGSAGILACGLPKQAGKDACAPRLRSQGLLLQFMNFVDLRRADGLRSARRPANLGAIDVRVFSEAEVQTPLILRAEAAAARDFLGLPLAVPEDPNLSADGAAIARRAIKLEVDPLVIGSDGVFIKQRGTLLIGDHGVELATVGEIAQRDRAPVINVGYADDLRDLLELARAVVDPYFLLLITRQATIVHRGPVLRVGNDRCVAARYF